MIPSAHAPTPNGETLPAALAHAAHRADWRVLAALCIGGAGGATVIALLAPHRWVFALPLVLPATFGGWGLTERGIAMLDTRGSPPTVARLALQVVGMLVIAIGAVAFTVLAYAVTFLLAGPAPVL
jgi:hypothetical protein